MSLVGPRAVELLVVRARKALRMTDHVAKSDVEAPHEPGRQLERRAKLGPVVEDLGVRGADVLDADRDVVEAYRMAAHHVERHELVDRSVPIDDEVRAVAGQLTK